MLNRISVNALLKGVIIPLSIAIIAMVAYSSWTSWSKWQATARMSDVAEASAHMFTALHNLRVDRSSTTRDLQADRQFSSLSELLQAARSAEMPALKSALTALQAIDIPERPAIVSDLDGRIKKLIALQDESAAALKLPKASRRQGLTQDYFNEVSSLLEKLDNISSTLTRTVKLEDSYVDLLLQLKQLAWVARNAAGDVSLMLSNALGGIPLPPDAQLKYNVNMARLETAWASLEDLASGAPLPASFGQALQRAKTEFMGPDYTAQRLKMLNALIAGEKPTMTADDWSRDAVAKLASLLGVAESSLKTAKEYSDRQQARAASSLTIALTILAVALALAIVMLVLVTRRVTGPLKQIREAMNKVATGDFNVTLPGLERKDEIGDVANAVERFKVLAVEKAREETELAMQRQQEENERQAKITQTEAAAQARINEERMKASEEQSRAVQALGEGLQHMSNGDLAYRLTAEFSETYQQIKDDFNAMAERMSDAMAAIKASTLEVSNASAEISASTTDLSQRTEEQAASLEETSASMEQIAATVKKNAENAQVANQSAEGAREVAGRGGRVVSDAVGAMARIEESSRKISDIIGVIDEIARQTNLLALNAAVEAARAGEAGRGFAVVASEVRSLAQRSSQAAKDIKDLIVSSNGQVKEGVDLVNRAGASLAEITESIKQVAEIVSNIASASAEPSIGITEVNKALTQMDEATQQNSALVEENAATAKTLETQAQAMNERVSFFRVEAVGGGRQAPVRQVAPVAKPAVRPAPAKAVTPARATQGRGSVGRMQAAVATAFDTDQDWKEF